MKRIIFALLCPLLFLINTVNSYAQETKNDTLAKALSDYFFLERENIHVQCNKSVYTTNEQIWFKGYVFHRKKNVPFFTTVNIFANLIDDTGKIISTQLVYGNIGSFIGNFKLDNSFKSGKYYLQFYTNWMNNFIEDESGVYEVTIINPSNGAGNLFAGPDLTKINIELHPEGGTLLSGVPNVMGISVSDCNHNALPVSEVNITDVAGKIVQKVQVNKLGYGRFTLPANAPLGYKAIVNLNNVKYEQAFPAAQLKGVALEINNFSSPDKTIVTINTNKISLESFWGKPIYLLVHKDDIATIYEINFKGSLTAKIAIANADFPEGMNTIRILDHNLNELAERLIYKFPTNTLSSQITKGSQTATETEYLGKVNYANMNLSVSALPENTRSLDETNDIYSSLLILPYIENQKKASGRYYFASPSKAKMYELDLFLLSQKSKYKWHNILKNPAKNTFTFDMGLTLKGVVPTQAGDVSFAKVRLYSLTSTVDETTDVNEKREFIFNNLLIPDSTYVNFTLQRKGQKIKELTLAPQLFNGTRKYNKPYVPQPQFYAAAAPVTEGNAVPNVFKDVTELEEVKIDAKRLKYANAQGNAYLRGYKITDDVANSYLNIVNYLKTYSGFNVDDRGGTLTIYSRQKNSINAAQSGPIIYIDNVQQLDVSILTTILLDEVDEIYMNPHAIVPSIRNYTGVIKIYLKKGVRTTAKNTTPEILVKSGYEKITPFKNINYNTTNDEGFVNFGVIDWKPLIMTNETGNFKLNITRTAQKSVKLLIEGFSADGRMLSEIKVVPAE